MRKKDQILVDLWKHGKFKLVLQYTTRGKLKMKL